MQPDLPTLHRNLHPATLQHLQQSPDGSLYPQVLPNLHPGAALYQQHQQYALSGPPQAAPQALHYLPGSPVQYAGFPVSYQHDTSPRFAVAPPLPVDGGIPQHFQAPPRPAPQQAPQRQHAPQQNVPQQHVQQPVAPPQHAPPRPAPEPKGGLQGDEGDSGQFKGLRLVADPPDLEAWRQKLFDVDDTITLNEDE